MQITNIRNSIAEVEILEKEESEIKKQIKENNVQWESDGDKTHLFKNTLAEIRLQAIEVKKKTKKKSIVWSKTRYWHSN